VSAKVKELETLLFLFIIRIQRRKDIMSVSFAPKPQPQTAQAKKRFIGIDFIQCDETFPRQNDTNFQKLINSYFVIKPFLAISCLVSKFPNFIAFIAAICYIYI
jgi:hypothetical protein